MALDSIEIGKRISQIFLLIAIGSLALAIVALLVLGNDICKTSGSSANNNSLSYSEPGAPSTPMPIVMPTVMPIPTVTPSPSPPPVPTITAKPTVSPTVAPGSNYSWPGYDYHWAHPSSGTTIDGNAILLVINGTGVTGNVTFSRSQLLSYPQHSVSMTLNGGATVSGTGPSLNDLLTTAGAAPHNTYQVHYNNTGELGVLPSDVSDYGDKIIVAVGSDNTLVLILDDTTGYHLDDSAIKVYWIRSN
jgi:hypothetical protein